MKSGGILHLAICSLRRHAGRTLVLAATVGIVVGLPLVIDAALGAYVQTVTARARATPILAGPWTPGRRPDGGRYSDADPWSPP